MYKKIYNFSTKRWVNVNGIVGRQLLSKMIGGAASSKNEIATSGYIVDHCLISYNYIKGIISQNLTSLPNDNAAEFKKNVVMSVIGTIEEFRKRWDSEPLFKFGMEAILRDFNNRRRATSMPQGCIH